MFEIEGLWQISSLRTSLELVTSSSELEKPYYVYHDTFGFTVIVTRAALQ